MYKNKTSDGKNNLCGERIKFFRKQLKGAPSQREFAEKLQVAGLDFDKNAVQRIENGKRFVTDIELRAIARVLGVTYQQLLDQIE